MMTPFSTTGIGSLPHTDTEEACRLILDTFDIPFWPQLPATSFREFMIPQFTEGMPFLKVDALRNAMRIERNGSDELERFYETWSDESRIAVSEDYAGGLYAFLRIIKAGSFKFRYIKGHVTGPLTFTLGLKDSAGRPVFFDEELREISLMLLKAKIRWQYDILKPHAEDVILFIDEPILSALGTSGYLGVSSEEALRLLKESSDAVKASGGISGIHCCGNADWPLVLQSGADIINFDAYDYIDSIVIYSESIMNFYEKGGYLAWGIIPTSDAVSQESPESIKARFDEGVRKLSAGIPESIVLSNMLLTPSCGTGSMTIEQTLKVFQLLMRLKEELE